MSVVPEYARLEIDQGLVSRLRGSVAEQLATELGQHSESGRRLTVEDQRMLGRQLVADAVGDHVAERARAGEATPSPTEEEALTRAVFSATFGLGRLGELLEDPTVENVDVIGCDNVWLSYADGTSSPAPAIASSDAELIEMVRSFAAYHAAGGREFSTTHPLLNLRLPDGSRLAAWMAVSDRPGLTVRRHRLLDVTLDDLVALGTLDPGLVAFLRAVAAAKSNVVITGRPNAGKTTLIRALASSIPAAEKLVVIEKEYELALDQLGRHRQVVSMEAREANAEGVGEVSLSELVVHALRMNPDRIIVGEVRSDELLTMLQAMHSGATGSLTSLHANSARDAMSRMTAIALSAQRPLSVEALHALVGGAVHYVVHLTLDRSEGLQRRYVASVVEVCGVGEGGRVATNEIYTPSATGRATPTGTVPARIAQLEQAGFDRSWLDRADGSWLVPDVARPSHAEGLNVLDGRRA
jgi:pilus assembly protein CpaF